MHEVADTRGTWDGRGVVRTIRTFGDPVLRQAGSDVTTFDIVLRRLVDDMFATMYAVDGIGLAANQIGVALNVFTFDCPDGFGRWHRGYMINPTRTFVAESSPDDSEGCLSIPGIYSEFPRSSHVITKGANLDGEPTSTEGFGYFARCLLHETQHLEGMLFVDLLKGDTRKIAMKAIRTLDLDSKVTLTMRDV